MPEFRRVHCTFCRQTFVTPALDECSLCRKGGGLVDAGSPAGLQSLAEAKRPQPLPLSRPEDVPVLSNPFALWSWFKVVATGIFLMIFGGFLMTPMFWSNPTRPTIGDLLPGFCAGVVGLSLLALVVAAAWPRRSRRADPVAPNPQPDAAVNPNPQRSEIP